MAWVAGMVTTGLPLASNCWRTLTTPPTLVAAAPVLGTCSADEVLLPACAADVDPNDEMVWIKLLTFDVSALDVAAGLEVVALAAA